MMNKIISRVLYVFLIICKVNVKSSNVTNTNAPKVIDNEFRNNDCQISLNLTNVGIRNVGPRFIVSTSVAELSLQNNEIQNISYNAFDGLIALKVLDLSNNRLSAKDTLTSFAPPTNLESLILNHNLNVSDSNKYQLNMSNIYRKLKYLSLRNTNIVGFYSKSNISYYLPEITHLDVSDNNLLSSNLLSQIPDTVTHLNLDNIGINFLDPDHKLWLRNVQSLSLNRNNINFIMDPNLYSCRQRGNICINMPILERLSITDCNLQDFQDGAFRYMNNLLSLNLAGNKIHTFGNTLFGSVPKLKDLDLSSNPLSTIPSFDLAVNLTKLIMNDMRDVSTVIKIMKKKWNLSKLEILSFSGDRILDVPLEMISNLPALKELNLSRNFIKNIGFKLGELKHLQKLDLSDNIIEEMDDLSLNGTASLELLDIQRNLITNFKASTFKYFPYSLVVIYKNICQ